MPSGSGSIFLSLRGIHGNSQTFANGVIYGITSGGRAGQASILNGLILARYLALSGPAGTLGIPIGDSFFDGAVQVQNFDTGYIDLAPGATAAVEHFNPRTPAISAAPATAGPGGRIHIGISGFAFGANLTVSITGQQGFSVTVPGGEFGWDIVIPGNAKSGTTTIEAKAADSTEAATGTYTISSLAQLQPTLVAVSGDGQTGMPGSALAAPLVAILRDVNGDALPGVPVSYTFPPVQALKSRQRPTPMVKSRQFRLPSANGAAALAISAAGRVVSFSAVATASSIQNFPSFAAVDAQGGLTAALAAEIRYYQNQGALGLPNGPATPAGLAQFLTANGGYSPPRPAGLSQIRGSRLLSPASLAEFPLKKPRWTMSVTLLNGGSPVLLELNVQQDGTPAGGAAVNAIGVNADGSIAISDPNPAFARVSLSDYLAGFSAQGHTVQATLSAVIRISPASVTPNGFVIAAQSSAAAAISSPAGPCVSVDLLDPAVGGGVRFMRCDGTQPAYQLGFDVQKGAACA